MRLAEDLKEQATLREPKKTVYVTFSQILWPFWLTNWVVWFITLTLRIYMFSWDNFGLGKAPTGTLLDGNFHPMKYFDGTIYERQGGGGR